MGQISRVWPLLSTIDHSRLQKLLHVCELYRLNLFIVHLQGWCCGERVFCSLVYYLFVIIVGAYLVGKIKDKRGPNDKASELMMRPKSATLKEENDVYSPLFVSS